MKEKKQQTEEVCQQSEISAQQEELTAEQKLEKLEENYKLLTEENERLIQESDKLTATVNRLQSSADKSDSYLTQLVALKNDFDSYKKRMRFNEENSKAQGIAGVVEKIFPILDTFAIARKHLNDENLKAFEMVEEQFRHVLDELGVVKMDVLGKPFDATTMNALAKVPAEEGKTDLVVEVYKDGYTFNDKVLRYAEVVVGQ